MNEPRKDFIGNAFDTMLKNVHRVEQPQRYRIDERFQHGMIGMASEGGELLDFSKAAMYYGKNPRWVEVIEELGDFMYYFFLVCDCLADKYNKEHPEYCIETSDMMAYIWHANNAKLSARYHQKFTEKEAITRDKSSEWQAIADTLGISIHNHISIVEAEIVPGGSD